MIPLESFAPRYKKDEYTEAEKWLLAPFFSNLDKSVYAPYVISPELIGAICSRASRATHDLRYLYLREFIEPFANPAREEKDTDETWNQKITHGSALQEFIRFLHTHSFQELFSNPRARSFFVKWLAQYGDDSIAQMAGSHLVFSGLSQVALKHIEDQRIGLAPIEKSTRYVNFGNKINGRYLYYIPKPDLDRLGITNAYTQALDGLFDTYTELLPPMVAWLKKNYNDKD
ncbi:FAD-dependent thymidylate synthase, partial [Candidatus Uhrbacteria bacterium]|nr:FAD-dependent thymidylate synthase [Candidatus Uhrbacteria bacterium]